MKSPERISPVEFRRQLAEYVMNRCEPEPVDQALYCRTCSGVIRVVDCAISIHTTAFDNCAGPGTVEHVLIPYCSRCESTPPSRSGCVHIDYGIIRASAPDPDGSLIGFRPDYFTHVKRLPNVE